ncbi:MAG: hypothetical protein Q4C67_10910, partial [Deinococcus sp.]|nr:hypothetical protein [Deinococcus sp.]
LLRATNGPFQGVVRAMHYGRTLLGQDTSQRVYRLEWCCPDSPELHRNRASRWSGDRQEGMFQVQGEVHTQAYGVATLRVLRAWPLDGACA